MMTPRRRGLALLVLFTAGRVSNGWSDDWPQWRGPNRDAVSVEKGLMPQWPDGGPPLLWSMAGVGKGYSGVVVVGDRLYTMGDLRDGKAQFLIAVDLKTRERVWVTRVGPPYGDGGSRCTPTVHNGLIYGLGTDADLVCADATSGKEVWRKNLEQDFGGQMMSGWRYSESPLVDGERLIVTPGGDAAALVALDRKTGAVIWKCAPPGGAMGGAGYASAVVSDGGGVRQYVTLMGQAAIGVKADDGTFLWAYPQVANGTANIPTPVAFGDYVFVSTAYGKGSALLKLVKTAKGVQAEQVYWLDANTFQCHHGGFLRVGDYLYGAHGHNQGAPICIELKTGKVLWRGKQPGRGSGALLYADGELYFRYEDDTLALVEATPQEFRLKSTFKMPSQPEMGGPGWAHLALANGKLYVRHGDVLLCFDVRGT